MMTDLLIVTGPPGAGKTTAAELLADRHDPSVLVRGDDFFAHLCQGAIDPWLPGADQQNHMLLPPLATALDRVAKRTGHGFTDAEAASHMHSEFSRAALEPRHVVVDDRSPAETAELIEVARSAGSLRWPR